MGDTPVTCPRCGARLSSPGEPCAACFFRAAAPEEADAASTQVAETGTSLGRAPGERAATSDLPETVGPYRIVGLLGEGGMGVVYLAEQSEPIRRRVALKVIKLGMDTRQVVARFDAERHALGLMDHPNIARVIDAGETADGRPYFVMEYVEGVSITEYCDAQRLTTRARLRLLTQVCGAVQHAHQKGVIHRDLKPSNVLVTELDGTAVPKIIDFGIAKATQQTLTERTLTALGQYVGTPEYMSPEQAGAEGLDVDATTDIYSLGVVLYELLVGALPFDPAALRRAGYEEMRRIIREDEPPKPSTRINGSTSSDVASHRQTDVGSLRKQLTGDLDWITLKALEKERSRRYASASELSADIDRYLNDEAVLASPPSATYRMKKFVRRNRLMVAASGLAGGTRVAGLVDSAILSRVAATALAEAETNLYFHAMTLIDKALADGDIRRVDALLAEAPVRRRHWEWHYLSRAAHMEEAVFTVGTGIRGFGTDLKGEHLFAAFASEDGLRVVVADADTGRIGAVARLDTRNYLPVSGGGVFSPDGRRFAGSFSKAQSEGEWETAVWDVNSGQVLYSLPAPATHDPFAVPRLAWSPDSARLITWEKPLETNASMPIIVRDAASGVPLASIGAYPDGVMSLTVSPDGRMLAVAQRTKPPSRHSKYSEYAESLTILNSQSGRVLARLTHPSSHALMTFPFGLPWRWSPDGRHVAVMGVDEVVCLFDALTGRELWSTANPRRDGILGGGGPSFTSSGKYLVAPSRDGRLRVLDPATGKELRRLSGHVGGAQGLVALPNANRMASIEDGFVRIWDVDSPTVPRLVIGSERKQDGGSRTVSVALSHDHRIVAALSSDAVLQIFKAESGERLVLWRPLEGDTRGSAQDDDMAYVAFNQDATRAIASISTATTLVDGTKRTHHDQLVFDLQTGRQLASLKLPEVRIASSPNLAARRAWSALDPSGLKAITVTNPKPREPTRTTADWYPEDATIDFWDVGSENTKRIPVPKTLIRDMEFSRDGRFAVFETVGPRGPQGYQQHERQIYEMSSGRLVGTIPLAAIAHTKDGRRLTALGNQPAIVLSNRSASPDGTRRASSWKDQAVALFDVPSGRQVATLAETSSSVREILIVGGYVPGSFKQSISFSADGTKIGRVTLSKTDQGSLMQIRTWDGSPVRPFVTK